MGKTGTLERAGSLFLAMAVTVAVVMVGALPAAGQDPCLQTTKLSATASGAQTWTGKKGAQTLGGSGDDAYGVETWTEAGGDKTKFTWYGPNQGGGYAYKAEWTESTDYLGRFGYFWGIDGKKWDKLGELCVDYNYTRSDNGTGGSYSYIGVYGWTNNGNNTEAEYYIVEDWYGNGQQNASNLGSGCQTHGNITVDGKTYQVVTCVRPPNSGCVTCNGKEFGQVFSLRQGMGTASHTKCGTISIKKHFEEWTKLTTEKSGQSPAKYIYGKTYESKFLTEAQGGTGWLDASYIRFSRTGDCGITVPPNNFTLFVAASPSAAGTATKSPVASYYPSGTKVTVTATPASGYKFGSWEGAVGTSSTLEVTITQNMNITAKFVPADTDPSKNLVTNGTFTSTDNWAFNTGSSYGNSEGTFSVANNKATVDVTKIGKEPWEPQLVQNNITLVEGMRYSVSFDASAASARKIAVIIQMAGGEYTTYFEKEVSLTTSNQTFTYEFTMEAPSDESGRIGFNLGQATGKVVFSNIKVGYAAKTGIAPKAPVASPAKSAIGLTVTPVSNSALSVSFSAKGGGKATVSMYSLKGDVVSSAKIRTSAGKSYTHTFNTAKLPTGFYVVKVSGDGFAEQARVAISK